MQIGLEMGKIWGVQPFLYAPLPQNITIFGFEATRRQGEAGRLLGTAWLPKKATEAPGSARKRRKRQKCEKCGKHTAHLLNA